MAHWLAVHLPRLPLEVFGPGPEGVPVAVGLPDGAQRVLIADAAAARRGVSPGRTLSAAHALCPDLVVRMRDPRLEDAALERLALWGERFTPTVALARPDAAPRDAPHDALLLEIGGCLALFGGLDALVDRVRTALVPLGHAASLASAPTARGALALARHGLERHPTDLTTLAADLDPLPVAALDLDPAACEWLAALGVDRIAALRTLPRAELAPRLGRDALHALDRACGHAPDPRAPFVPPPRFDSTLVLSAAVRDVEPLLFGARRLVHALTGFLAGREQGVVRCSLRLAITPDRRDTPVDDDVVRVVLSAPSRDPVHLLRLLRERLGRHRLHGAVDALRLTDVDVAPLASRSLSFLDARGSAAEDHAALIEQLRARLGHDAVHAVAAVPDHRPERAWRSIEPTAVAGRGPTAVATDPDRVAAARPLWLLPSPRPWVAPAGTRRIAGPERIESGWWDDDDVRRDYLVVETPDGERAWVFRTLATTDAAAATQWWLHGWFA